MEAAELVVVDLDPAEPARLGEHPRLRLDRLGDEHPAHLAERGVELQAFDVAGELLDPVDLAAPLDLDRDDLADRVAADEVDRTDRRRVLAPHQRETDFDRVRRGGEQLLEVGLDAVLLQPRIVAEVGRDVGDHLVQRDRQRLALLVGDDPPIGRHDERVRGVHPVQRLVRATVGVDGHAPVGLHHDQPRRLGQVGGQATRVVDRAASDHEAHAPKLPVHSTRLDVVAHALLDQLAALLAARGR